MRTAAAGAILALLIQTATAVPYQQPAAKGSIEGTVTRAGTGDPIPGARVTIARIAGTLPAGAPLPPPPPPPPGRILDAGSVLNVSSSSSGSGNSVLTDGQGRFTFRDLDSGVYRVSVGANGYAKQEYGQRSGGQGTPVNVTPGQSASIVIPLSPAGSVSGRIRDNRGQPAVGIQVQVIKQTYNGNGQKSFQSAGSSRTDDRGEYRLYWITPGRYLVMASSGASPTIGGIVSSPNEMPADSIAPTYYPGSVDISQAASIEIKPGADIGGADIIVTRQPPYRIRGRLVDSRSGQNPAAAGVSLTTPSITGGINIPNSVVTYDPRDGSFEIRDVTPGPHVIRATISNSSNTVTLANAGTISAASQAVSGQVALNVMSDIDGVVVTLTPGVSIPGRLTMEATANAGEQSINNLAGYRVQLMSSDNGAIAATPVALAIQSQAISGDGTFRADNVIPGEYRVFVAPLRADVYVKQARFNQNDVLNGPLKFSASDSGTLEILLSSRGGQITGSVLDERQRGVPNILAVLIPDRQRDRIDLYKSAMSDANGLFSLRSIAPGDYHLFAWEALDSYAYFDPDVVRQFESKGKPVHIAESAKENVDVQLIPAEP